ncbi:hypothetical protein AgCh_022852 [Apium graveolens]
MLLGAYFVQIDGTLNKLSTVEVRLLMVPKSLNLNSVLGLLDASVNHLKVVEFGYSANGLECGKKLPKAERLCRCTEDYINIMLDDKQNQLLQMGVVLTTATLYCW